MQTIPSLARAMVAALCFAATCAQAITTFWYQSLPGEYIGNGRSMQLSAPDSSFTAWRYNPSHIEVAIDGGSTARIQLAAPPDTPLATGVYEEVARAPFRGNSPGLQVSIGGPECEKVHGRFVIFEIVFAETGDIQRLAANFEQWCDDASTPLHGELRLNSDVPLTATEPGSETIPDPFALQAQSPVKGGSFVDSNPITIYGVSSPVAVSMTGGEYSVNGGPFTAAAGVAQPLDRIVTRVMSAKDPGSLAFATLNAGGRAATLSVRTYQPGEILTGISIDSSSGGPLGHAEKRLLLSPANTVAVEKHVLDDGLWFRVTGVEGLWYDLHLSAPGSGHLTPGTYEAAVGWSGQAASQPGINFGGNGSGCIPLVGRFVVHEAIYAADGSVERFAADFEERCDPESPPASGEIRYNSSIPFHVLAASCTGDGSGCVADIVTTQSIDANPAASGKDAVFRLTARNNGPDVAHNVTLASTYAGANIVWASPSCARDVSSYGGTIMCAIGTLEKGASARFTLVLRKDEGGGMYNSVRGEGDADPNSANSSSRFYFWTTLSPAGVPVWRYRLYSPVTLEHHFTTDVNEYNVLGGYVGTWIQEGTVGRVLDNPGSYNGVGAVPYYRLYDTTTRWHHWTTDPNEYYTLSTLVPWWNGEGVDGYVLPTQAPGTTQLYRLLYPFVPGLHHWTIDPVEYNALVDSYGWVGEGGSGFVIP